MRRPHLLSLTVASALALGAALGRPALAGKADAPVPAATLAVMASRNVEPGAPILVRAYKKEAELEVWKRARTGRYTLIKTFPICRWSGQLGPKQRNGDRQTPEGFYPVSARQMNPNSSYYLSFDVGYPNAFDRAHGSTGSFIMVHGTCSSMGCFAMTDRQVGEIYALAREAFAGGQAAFQFQSYPFRMTAQNMARHRTDPNIAFWRQLKDGSDRFEATGEEPVVGVAGGRYTFAPSRDASREVLATARRAEEDAKVAALVADGMAAIRTTYSDGGQHPSFKLLASLGTYLGDISRPEALPLAGREVVVIPARRKPATPTIQVASVRPDNLLASAPSPVSGWSIWATIPAMSGDPAVITAAIPGATAILAPALAPSQKVVVGSL